MKETNLTSGNILKQISTLALPIIGASFVQVVYNMTDMIWLGNVSSSAVAAVGTAGIISWMGLSWLLTTKIGAEVCTSQSIGENKLSEAKIYAQNSISLSILISLLFGIITFFGAEKFISIFDFTNPKTISDAVIYIKTTALFSVLGFPNTTFSGIFTGYGESKTPFWIALVGLFTNIILDPILIFGYGPIPPLGVKGAAIATVISKSIVFVAFITLFIKKDIFSNVKELLKISIPHIKRITKIGLPVAIQSSLFASIAIVVFKAVSQWGDGAVAVIGAGAQIESICWMTASGFATALGSFTGQNFGAKKWARVYKGFSISLILSLAVGLIASFVFYFKAEEIFTLFVPEPDVIAIGTDYLKILALSQVFMNLEITTGGGFNGIGKTMPPTIISILLNTLRIPGVYIIPVVTTMGLNGIWWTISALTILKGTVIFIWFLIFLNRISDKPYYRIKFKKAIYRFIPDRNKQLR